MMFILFFMVIACGTGQQQHIQRELSTAGYEPFAYAPVETLDVAEDNSGAVGFHGGFNDGSYGYLVPYTDTGAFHGKVVRFDLTTFKNVQVLDVAETDAGAGVIGFSGGFQDGTYGYLVPCWTSNRRNVVRFDLATFSEVLVLDVAAEHAVAKGFLGGFQDGTYGYLVPYKDDNYHGNVVRFSLATFSDVQVLDVAAVADDTGAKGFFGGFNDGSYGYLVPYYSGVYHGKVVRFDLTTFSEVEVLDVAADAGAGVNGFSGGFQDGTYGYLVPTHDDGNGRNVVRFDLATFRDVLVLDVAAADASAKGFQGGFQDGTYGYLVPFKSGSYHGNVVRFNLATFSDVQVLDVAADDTGAKGFFGGFNDGSYGYLVPHYRGVYHGKVVRFNLAPPQTTTTTSSTMTSSMTTSSITTSSTTFLPPSECTVGYLRCPVPDGQSYTVLGSEGFGNCSVDGATSQFLSFAIGECNASITTYDNKQIYLATLIRATRGPFEIFGDIDIACSCEVVTVADAQADTTNLVNPSNPFNATGLNDFEPELRVFLSDSFITPLTAREIPSPATKNFYFEIASTSSDDNIGVVECWTAPSSNEDDSLTQELVGTSCDAGLLGFRRLESPSSHILRIETLAFKFRDFDSVHVRCTVVRCGDARPCGSCASARRLSASASGVTSGSAAASFAAPASVGTGGIIIIPNGPTAAGGLGEGETQDMMTGHTVARAIPAWTFFIGTWMVTTAA